MKIYNNSNRTFELTDEKGEIIVVEAKRYGDIEEGRVDYYVKAYPRELSKDKTLGLNIGQREENKKLRETIKMLEAQLKENKDTVSDKPQSNKKKV